MSSFLKNTPLQLYLSLAPLGVGSYLAIHALRDFELVNKLFVSRSKEKVPDSFVDLLDAEFESMSHKVKKRFTNANFAVSLIDNLEARTYGSFHIRPGAEFQVPTISTIPSKDVLKKQYPNLLDLVKELKLDGSVETAQLPEETLQSILLSPLGAHFFLRREITIAESMSHLVVPSVVGFGSIFLGYPVMKMLVPILGGYQALVLVGIAALLSTYYILESEIRSRTLATDRRVMENDKSMVQGALEYFNARLAFGKLLHQNGYSKVFDNEGNCLKQNAKYTDRLQQVHEFILHEKQKAPRVNVREL